jgi:hypothetical protein
MDFKREMETKRMDHKIKKMEMKMKMEVASQASQTKMKEMEVAPQASRMKMFVEICNRNDRGFTNEELLSILNGSKENE